MKKLLFALAITFVAHLALAQQTTQADTGQTPSFKAHVLTNAELDEWLSRPEKVLFIDVRRPDEVSSIGGFPVYLSIQLNAIENSLKWIPKDRTIITVSNHAARAGKAADLLASKGFNVAGAAGVDTYEKTGGKGALKIAVPPTASQPATTTRNK